MSDTMALEMVQFKVSVADEEAMLAARPGAVEAIRESCPGVIDARLFRGEAAGEWIDVWFWASLQEAVSAAEVAMSLPEAGAFFAFIAEPPVMVHGTLVAEDLHG